MIPNKILDVTVEYHGKRGHYLAVFTVPDWFAQTAVQEFEKCIQGFEHDDYDHSKLRYETKAIP